MSVVQFSSDIQFTVDYCPENFRYDFERYLYNESKFLKLQSSQISLSFYILNTKKKRILGRVHFVVKGRTAQSLHRSPFGGLEINAGLSLNLTDEFISFQESYLKKAGIQMIIVKQFPLVYSETSASKITNCYIRAGYKIIYPDLNHHIHIDGLPFADKIHNMEKRKLQKSKIRGFVFKDEPSSNLEVVYEFILACRKEKGQNLNISLDDLRTTMELLPDAYKIFTIRNGHEIIAGSVVVMVNQRIAYNFLPASKSSYNQCSPMVFLLANIYDYFYENKIEIFDLGISSIENIPQNSLMAFKERIGGNAGLKLTFEKNI